MNETDKYRHVHGFKLKEWAGRYPLVFLSPKGGHTLPFEECGDRCRHPAKCSGTMERTFRAVLHCDLKFCCVSQL